MPTQEKIRVLIVDDIAETRENIKRLLQFDLKIEIVGSARSGHEAIELSQQTRPDVVIMDINMPDMDGITATEAIRRKVPHAQVVILSVQSDPGYMRRAMLAGARDFIAKPPSIDELTTAIHRAGIMAKDERNKAPAAFTPAGSTGNAVFTSMLPLLGKIVVVYSPKGGTGATTIATNLALALHTDETRTALIDGSLQYGDVAVFLNEQVRNNVQDLTQRVDELDPEMVNEVMIAHRSGIKVLPAPPRPELAESIAGEQFSKLLDYLRQIFAFIVVDTSSYLSDAVQAALEIADLIILITTQDIPAVKNANQFLTVADASGIHRNRILFVMNRYDKRISIAPERISESLRQEIVLNIPLDEKVITNSVNRGIPFVLENKTQPSSKLIYNLADLIKERIAKLEEVVEHVRKK